MKDLINTIKYLIYVVVNHPLRLLSINFLITSLVLEYLKRDYSLYVAIGFGIIWAFIIVINKNLFLFIILVISIAIPIILFNRRSEIINEKSQLLLTYIEKTKQYLEQ